MCMAIYPAVQKTDDPANGVLMSKFVSRLVSLYYSDLTSKLWFTVHEITGQKKRDIATTAKTCFQCSADTVDKPLDKRQR
jgi:hypothetical protein